MNVKESHIVTGMSRDSSVSRQNPNLVYDAHNIRITTKDGKNSLLSVTNEKGTKRLTSSGDSVVGVPLGDAVVDKYIVLFTHNAYAETNKDHIYRCELDGSTIDVTTIFEGDAGFDLEYPIETLAVLETETIQKVYWVDGKNQPRVINAVGSLITNQDLLNFSREITLTHKFDVVKVSTGGEFPVGTIQYAFSYYKKFGQESRIVDISPMYYLSPQEGGLNATEIANCSFELTIKTPDDSFDYVRVYSIVRTSANSVPQCRIVGDYAIKSSSTDVVVTDNGVGGTTISAGSLYFIGGEELIAGTIAQKDNTIFLGDIKLNKPNVGNIELSVGHTIRSYVKDFAAGTITADTFYANIGRIVESNIGYSPDDNRVPTMATKYYDYNPNNNRSSYYIRRFKYKETYRFGFIAQYKNGQWSEPIWVGDFANNYQPNVSAGNYRTGCFHLNMPENIITKLKSAGFKRIAPVVVYPKAHERTAVMQGLLCPSMYNKKDRQDNSPYAQSSWFFRLYHNVAAGDGSYCYHNAPIGGSSTVRGEIQCVEVGASSEMFYMDGNIVTFHSPDIECVNASQNTDLEGLGLRIIGFASASSDPNYPTDLGKIARVTDRFLETENIGIDTDIAQIISMRRTGYTGYSIDHFCYPLYLDGIVANDNKDEVVQKDRVLKELTIPLVFLDNPVAASVVYPWHRSGSLNNQQALTTKQRSNGFNTRTAMLKRNITANAWFTNTTYFATPLSVSNGIYTPKIFNYDQLAGVKAASGNDSFVYYGNIDKILTSVTGKYRIYYGWIEALEDLDLTNITTLSEAAMADTWWKYCNYADTDESYYTGTDPVSMKYKSSPHMVLRFKPNGNTALHMPMYTQDAGNLAFTNSGATGSGLYIAELIRTVNPDTRFGGKSEEAFIANEWIRCGESKRLDTWYHATSYLEYQQGDCYIQRYDCLKTYPFTNEDVNSVIETLSATLETYVNLDFRCDSNRGSGRNIALSPTNFNLYNHPAYEQVNNFFAYHGLDYERFAIGAFPNTVTWSLEKHLGEDVDTWASIDASNTIELNGAFGKINKLINYNNEIYCFQDIGMAQLLFNSRVQIPTSDNTPIEITNGSKMLGKKYISTQIGCTNKWSIVETPLGLYFNDDILKATYMYNGQLADLSTNKGMKSWMNENCKRVAWSPDTFENCHAYYDKVGRDVYWVYSNTALVYSEILGQYMSFMDYGNVPLLESLGNSTYAVTNNYSKKTTAEVKWFVGTCAEDNAAN